MIRITAQQARESLARADRRTAWNRWYSLNGAPLETVLRNIPYLIAGFVIGCMLGEFL